MSILVKDLVKIYGEQKAVNHISFEVHKGEIVGFLGPNGAGKSTTMKIITGYIHSSGGVAHICGINVSENPLVTPYDMLDTRSKVSQLPVLSFLYVFLISIVVPYDR